MPNLSSIPIVKYDPLDPYHHYYDNLPIESIENQLFAINAQTNLNQVAIEESVGTAGSLSVRLNKSLEADGDLKSSAIDAALHNISQHIDGGGYVRMTDVERSKLSLIDSEATNLTIQVDTISTTLTWPGAGQVFKLADSDSIAWRIDSGEVLADTTFSLSLVTSPSYDIIPVTVNSIDFKTTSINTAYKAGSLRVYINGLRLTKSPKTVGGYYYIEDDPSVGTFSLNTALSGSDFIRIDFDQPIS